MDDIPHDQDRKSSDLRAALRVARQEEAERAQAVGDLRDIEWSRLHLLREAIEPVLAQVPAEIDLFDTGLLPGPRPRLFIDMIAFVEMGRDRRQYRFIQDKRHGRVVLAESDRLDQMREAVSAYIARRLVEREKALSAEPEHAAPLPAPTARAGPSLTEAMPEAEWSPERSRGPRLRSRLVRLVVDYLGIVALCVLAWMLWRSSLTWR